MVTRQLAWFAAVVLILALSLTCLTAHGMTVGPYSDPSGGNSFQIHFLNQGRVDAILIVSNGEAMFIDSGSRPNGLASIKYMRRMGITKLRFYVGTHAHKDHVAGAAPIIQQMRPDQVFIPHAGVKSAIANYAVGSKERRAVASTLFTVLRPGNSFPWNDLTLSCLGPLKINKCSKGSLMENYNSLILRIDRGDRHMVLLTGDTSAGVLDLIERRHRGSIRSEILKNPHHNGAQPESLLRKISPKIVAICNSSIPSRVYRKRILKIGAAYYTAYDKTGNFVLEESGESWAFSRR
jgi:competence protein ComEC